MHATAAQTAATSRSLILAAAACMTHPGGSPRFAQLATGTIHDSSPSGCCVREEHCQRLFHSLMVLRK